MTATSLQYSSINNAEAFSNLLFLPIDISMSGGNILISGIQGKRIYVYRLMLVIENDATLNFKNGPDISMSGPIKFLENSSLLLDISNVPWFQTNEGNDFVLESDAMSQISGMIYFQQK